jgi:ATP-dependent helicase Lhr and Lhr-like helicase
VGDLAPLGKTFSSQRPVKIIHNAEFERRVLAAIGVTLHSVFDTVEASRRTRGVDVLGGPRDGMRT